MRACPAIGGIKILGPAKKLLAFRVDNPKNKTPSDLNVES